MPAAEPWVRGHASIRGLESVDAAEGRGDADGAAPVGADGQRRKAGRDRRAGAAARSAGRQIRIPWIARDPEERIVGHALVTELGRVRLAEEDGARALQPLDDDG